MENGWTRSDNNDERPRFPGWKQSLGCEYGEEADDGQVEDPGEGQCIDIARKDQLLKGDNRVLKNPSVQLSRVGDNEPRITQPSLNLNGLRDNVRVNANHQIGDH